MLALICQPTGGPANWGVCLNQIRCDMQLFTALLLACDPGAWVYDRNKDASIPYPKMVYSYQNGDGSPFRLSMMVVGALHLSSDPDVKRGMTCGAGAGRVRVRVVYSRKAAGSHKRGGSRPAGAIDPIHGHVRCKPG